MAKTKFSEVEEFYIAGHLGDDPKAVAKALGKPRQHKAVAARQDEIRLAKPKASPMITEAQHGRKGVAIMTQAAASIPAVAEGREAYLERNKSFLHNPLPNGG
jgi:hypothetical protein